MNKFEQIKQEALAITDPHQAHIKIWTSTELALDEMEQIAIAYQEKYKVDTDEMAFYPNGERVLTLEVFWENTKE